MLLPELSHTTYLSSFVTQLLYSLNFSVFHVVQIFYSSIAKQGCDAILYRPYSVPNLKRVPSLYENISVVSQQSSYFPHPIALCDSLIIPVHSIDLLLTLSGLLWCFPLSETSLL